MERRIIDRKWNGGMWRELEEGGVRGVGGDMEEISLYKLEDFLGLFVSERFITGQNVR